MINEAMKIISINTSISDFKKERLPIRSYNKKLKKLTIPIQLLEQAQREGMMSALKVFIGAKMFSSRNIVDNSNEFKSLCVSVGLQRRTVLKHFDHLIEINWVGYDIKTKKYHIRPWTWFYSQGLFFASSSVRFSESYLAVFPEFVAAAIIGDQIRKMKYYSRKQVEVRDPYLFKVNKKMRKFRQVKEEEPVTITENVTSQTFSPLPDISKSMPQYYGHANRYIATMLNCKYTKACNLKLNAAKAGFLSIIRWKRIIQVLPGPDYYIHSQYKKAFGDDAGKLYFSTEVINGKHTLCLVQDLRDEIIPLLSFVQVNYRAELQKKKLKERKSPKMSLMNKRIPQQKLTFVSG
jgi:hypothetical protein